MTVKLFEQTAELMACFDLPDKTLEAVGRVQDKLLKLIPIDPRGRIMFDYEQVQPRDANTRRACVPLYFTVVARRTPVTSSSSSTMRRKMTRPTSRSMV